jgi:ATP-dependent RNA helicase DeaD
LSDFKQLGLSDSTLKVLEQIGFEKPTPIQEQAIPVLLKDEATDLVGLAQTGTGKTAAFGLPLVERVDDNDPSLQALIMAPTRELGQQTAQQLVAFSKGQKKLNVEVVYGGASIMDQIRALKRPTQIVVATPGRLLDLIKRRAIKLSNVKYVVLDEADEMLNMGFKEDIDEILSHTMEDRVTWLFSATMPREIKNIAKKYMNNPVEVAVNKESEVNTDISHQYVITKTANKVPAVRRFLDIQPEMRGIMFCRTKRETQEIADDLGNLGYGVEALHGDLSQSQRDAVMRRFKQRSMQLLVATDVAARGIDVNDLTHVMHHKLPDQLESYTHRSGRTARAGRKGISLAFINPREVRQITMLERRVKVKFEQVQVPNTSELRSTRINNWASVIVNTKVDEQADSILQEMGAKFEELSKEDILKRLITTQLDHLNIQDGGDDLNDTSGGSRDRDRGKSGDRDRSRGNDRERSRGGDRDRGDRAPSPRGESGGPNRYFVNLGTMDGVTSGDLLHFLSDVSTVDRKHFSQLSLQKNCAFFNVEESMDKNFEKSFNGIEVEGRSVRVNKDDDGGSSKPASRGNGGSFKQRFRSKQGGRPSGGNRPRSSRDS